MRLRYNVFYQFWWTGILLAGGAQWWLPAWCKIPGSWLLSRKPWHCPHYSPLRSFRPGFSTREMGGKQRSSYMMSLMPPLLFRCTGRFRGTLAPFRGRSKKSIPQAKAWIPLWRPFSTKSKPIPVQHLTYTWYALMIAEVATTIHTTPTPCRVFTLGNTMAIVRIALFRAYYKQRLRWKEHNQVADSAISKSVWVPTAILLHSFNFQWGIRLVRSGDISSSSIRIPISCALSTRCKAGRRYISTPGLDSTIIVSQAK